MVIDIDDLSKAKKMILKNHTNILLNTWNVSPKIPAFFIALKSLILIHVLYIISSKL